MRKSAPTFIDEVIRESYRDKFIPASYRDRLIRARKFILDESMSAFLADLSNAAISEAYKHHDTDHGEAMYNLMHGARRMAKAPFPITWIEYDCVARRKRSKSEWPQYQYKTSGHYVINDDDIIPRTGWLIEQHPSLDAAYRLTCFIGGGHGICTVEPFAYTWVTDDATVIPWHPIPISNEGRQASELATGCMGLLTPHINMTPTEMFKLWGHDDTKTQMLEMVGELRATFMLLTSINRLTTTYEHVRPAKGYFAKGKYRHFVEHSVIRLMVPGGKSTKTLAMRALVPIRRRAHEVRGFWREDWRHPRSPTCQHVWINIDERHLGCQYCDAKRLWVASHQRGDASLGFVLHDYSVERERVDG